MAEMAVVQGDRDDEIDLAALIGKLWGRKFTIVMFAVVAVAGAFFYSLLAPPVYQADALVQLEEKSSGGLALSSDLADMLGGKAPVSVAEIEIIRSRMVLGTVVRNLHLDWQGEPVRLPVVGDFLTRYRLPEPGFGWLKSFAWHDERIVIGNLDMPNTLPPDPLILTAEGGGRYTLAVGGRTLNGKVGQTLRDDTSGLVLLVDVLTGNPGRQFRVNQLSFSKALEDLRRNLSVAEKGRNSSILQLALKDRDPVRAARILNEITRVYQRQNLERNAAEAESSLQFILDQLPAAEADVHKAEAALSAFQTRQDSVDLSFETKALLQQSIDIEAELNQLELQEQELSKRFTKSHPAYQTLLEKRAELEKRLAEIRSKTSVLPEAQQETLRLTQNLKVAQDVLLQLQSRAQELKVLKAGTIANVRVIDTALAGADPVAPKKTRIVALALVLGLFAGTGHVLLRGYMARGVRSAEEIEGLGLSVYATIPSSAIPAAADKRAARMEILAVTAPTDLAAEALRSLRTSLHFGMLDASNKLCTITSSIPGEGKSFVSVNLATVLATGGQKICLVDADLRRGYLHRYFGLHRKDTGLSDYLAGDVPVEDIIRKDEKTGLSYIITGKYPPNPAELLMHDRFRALCAHLDGHFDLALFDTPPVLAVTDPILVGKLTGTIMLVARSQTVQAQQIQAALKKFEINGLRPSGVIFNGDDPKTRGYGYTNYQYQYEYKTRGGR